jgi:uncharacterized protein (DUF2336 family)
MSEVQSLTAELDSAMTGAPVARRIAMLQQVTVLFLESAASYTKEQLAIFDAVFTSLCRNIERTALIELSGHLAAAAAVPAEIARLLASDDDIAVAGPILKGFDALADEVIADVAKKKKGAAHLVAIVDRPSLSESVTDALISRGVPEISRKIVARSDARISHVGFVKLLNSAKGDRQLAEMIAARADLPAELQPFVKMALEKA